MAMPLLESRRWTADDVRALPDDRNRYECIDGELLVTPSPSYDHHHVVAAFVRVLDRYVMPLQSLDVIWSPSDVEIEPGTLVQPDLFVAISRRPGRRIRDWREIAGLMLAIEVLSPSTARVDRGRKRMFYQRAGVGEYWIVDPDARLVERWRPRDERPEVIRESLEWQPEGTTEPLKIDLPSLFAAALDD